MDGQTDGGGAGSKERLSSLPFRGWPMGVELVHIPWLPLSLPHPTLHPPTSQRASPQVLLADGQAMRPPGEKPAGASQPSQSTLNQEHKKWDETLVAPSPPQTSRMLPSCGGEEDNGTVCERRGGGPTGGNAEEVQASLASGFPLQRTVCSLSLRLKASSSV